MKQWYVPGRIFVSHLGTGVHVIGCGQWEAWTTSGQGGLERQPWKFRIRARSRYVSFSFVLQQPHLSIKPQPCIARPERAAGNEPDRITDEPDIQDVPERAPRQPPRGSSQEPCRPALEATMRIHPWTTTT